jgi:SpoVK/Ycf46/Vps4 family AAA+-type ATPase
MIMNIAVAAADAARRGDMWLQALHGLRFNAGAEDVARLTQQFQLSSGQIETVSKQLRLQAGGNRILPLSALAEACREVSHHGLSELSVSVKASYHWDDLVLPAELKQQLQDICAQVRFRSRVFDDWGFAQKLPYGRGLSAMFSGNPGTGKTMAAQVVARELQLELFKIDLSGIVSKYIGETEKNLNRVFAEAQASNAILFFDEADALFGKRTDVSDAHDRYANIEVSYLLQKMEEYDGIVILATNFRNNVDDAFTRRIRFIIEFPFPDADSRCEIWRRGIPAATPVAPDLDFQWLADRIRVAGGNIKNIILNAAFAAAQQQQSLGMAHLLESCKLEFQKIGKLWEAGNMHYTNRQQER